jgi:ATP-dependent Lhr-like helicase
VAQGLVTADAFSPLRWLIRPETEKRRLEKRLSRRRIGASAGRGKGLLGRWSLMRAGDPQRESALFPEQARLAGLCEALLLRYGVVFRAVLERETGLPPWRQLLRYLRRMEDRGEVHGGRFVDGFSGEQFALPEAVGLLRRCAAQARERRLLVISAADPLNLGGIITPGVKTAARPGNRILLLSGLPVARLQREQLELLGKDSEISSAEAERHLRSVRRFPPAAAGRGAAAAGSADSRG